MIDFYFYEGQLRSYLLQFCNIFAGLKVQTGKGECDEPEFMTVPIAIGSRDRVVAAIQAGNTQNRPFALPMMVAYMSGLSLAASRKGTGVLESKTFLPRGGIYPDDLRVMQRVMPIPYNMQVDLSICTSNTQQTHQILEQLLMLFDPTLQIQTSDAAFDWTKISAVELIGMTNEENYPAASDRRIINWTLNFEMPIYISAPVDIKDNLVKKIFIQIGDMAGFSVNEFDNSGNLVPFTGEIFKTIEIDAIDLKNVVPPTLDQIAINQGATINLVSPGAWVPPDNLTFTYEWYANNVPLVEGVDATGVNSTTMTIIGGFPDGTGFSCKVTATKPGAKSVSAFSSAAILQNVG